MKRAKVFIPIVAIILVSVIAMPDRDRSSREDNSKELGFPFEMVSEEFSCCFAPPTWQVRIRIPKDSYSRENLDRLFRFYALRRHPSLKERLYVDVYVGDLNRSGDLRSDDASLPELPVDADDLRSIPDGIRWDASFRRVGYGSYAGREEYYSYRPDSESDEEKLVILKGTLINRSKTIVESWETSNRNIRLRVLAYYLEGVDPAGVFYTFQLFDPDRKWPDWEQVMTSRQDQQVPIPSNSVVFLTDNIAYVTMGSMLAVTTDSGKNWAVWDAERDFELSHWTDSRLIEQLDINASGNGTMKLSTTHQPNEPSFLRTSDFGRTWSPD